MKFYVMKEFCQRSLVFDFELSPDKDSTDLVFPVFKTGLYGM